MKKLLAIGGILFAFASSSVVASGLDKEEREEYINCEKMAWHINEYSNHMGRSSRLERNPRSIPSRNDGSAIEQGGKGD